MQDNDIMPAFMIVFSDNTFTMIPFVATTKATFYRIVNEITENIDFNAVEAIFYCSEYYVYDIEQFPEINEKSYSERLDMAKKEMLSFTMLMYPGDEWVISFDENKINDMEYIANQLRDINKTDLSEQLGFDWLTPLKEKLKNKKI